IVCFLTATTMKRKLGYDDSLDVFGVHGIGGIIGALLTGVFAAPALGGFADIPGIGAQFMIQLEAVLFTLVYTAVLSYAILKVLDMTLGLRVSDEAETMGLDLAEHEERGYIL